MKTGLKVATSKARATLRKLEALAARGVDGEKLVAQRKLERLRAQFDFEAPDPAETPDLFAGSFKPSDKTRWIYSFAPGEVDVANSVKWAIETATGIRCLYRDRDLLAEAAPSTARRLSGIAEHVAQSFRVLIAKFSATQGVSLEDRGVFTRGLFDGMMNELREAGQPLPSRPAKKKRGRSRNSAVNPASGLGIHPYSLAFGLGKQIRFSAPLQEISAELEGWTERLLAKG